MAISTASLSYRFGKQLILDAVTLKVPRGGVYGFLGPNGAGKTTTIKLLLSLLQSSARNIFIFGKELSENRIEILSRIGSLVEQPALYPHLTGRENLRNRALLLQIPKARVEEILELVGLAEAGNKKAGNYSLGMKQRLGIGLALLNDPDLLILDEPTNGLDPNGIIEIRHLVKKLSADHGKTVFISSHLLSEVEKMATHVGIINRGKLLFQGSIEELHQLNQPVINVTVDDPAGAAGILREEGIATSVHADGLVIPYQSRTQMAGVNTMLVRNGYTVYSIMNEKKDLEHLFLNITQN
ncbi:MAG TPA: ATP-binding cassette domain-containing protein [Sphingobacteriaceae bacterium]